MFMSVIIGSASFVLFSYPMHRIQRHLFRFMEASLNNEPHLPHIKMNGLRFTTSVHKTTVRI